MSRLYFECRFKAYKLRSLDFPIEVRKPNLTLVARRRSSEFVELEGGNYYLVARLPTDRELYDEIQLKEDTYTLAILTADEEDQTASETQETFQFLGALQDTILHIGKQGSSAERSNPLASGRSGNKTSLLRAFKVSLFSLVNRTSLSEGVAAKIRLCRGNVLEGSCDIVLTDDWLSPLQDVRSVPQRSKRLWKLKWFDNSHTSVIEDLRIALFSIWGENRPQLIQLLQPRMPAINVMLPISTYNKCYLILKQLPDNSCAVDIHLANAEADLLLRYLQEGLFTQGVILTSSELQIFEAVLNMKLDDPVAAAVCAYALLRFNDLARLKDWTDDLSSKFAWLPDAIAIRGEYLARSGEHNQALTLFHGLPSRGLPVFSDGLSYIIDRLRLYTQFGEALFDSEQISQARTLLGRLQSIAIFVDFRQSLLTFNGIDPGNPEDNPLGADITSYIGQDVAMLLRPPRSKRQSLLAVIRNIRIRKVIASLSTYFATYGALIPGIGVIIPIIAAPVTLIFYLLFNLLPPLSFLTLLKGEWYALICGVFLSGVLWGVLPTLLISFASPKRANARSYWALKSRLNELENQLGISEFSELKKKSLTSNERQRAAKVDPDENYTWFTLSSLDEAYTSYRRVSEEIEKSATDLRWLLGTGYIEMWKTLHRAEEALVQFKPSVQVMRDNIRISSRIQGSGIGNRMELLHLLRQAVKNTDNTARLPIGKVSDASNLPFNRKQIMARFASSFVREMFNNYRDSLWQGLLQRRKLLLGQLLVTGIATYILLCFAIFLSNPTTIIEASIWYFVGSIAGIFGPLYRKLKRNTAIDDYGFTWTFVPTCCAFSGLFAVFSLLVIGRLDIPNISPFGLLSIWLHIFHFGQLPNLLIAVFLGLLSNLYFRGLLQKVKMIETDLLRSNAPPSNVVLLELTQKN